mgnify:CR=1 FL=1|jgi:hypothetical protein
MKSYLIIFLNILLISGAQAQSVSNIVAETSKDIVKINYDLNGTDGAKYYVNLYYSIDGGMNFNGPLRHVSGDVQSEVISGKSKTIDWEIFKELNYQNEPIQFKIEALPNVRKAKLTSGTYGKITITNATYEGDNLIIDFEFLPEIEKESDVIYLHRPPYITLQNGEQVFPSKISFGSGSEDDINSVTRVDTQVINKVPVKGKITFKTNSTDSIIPSLWFLLLQDYKKASYIIRDIPISK